MIPHPAPSAVGAPLQISVIIVNWNGCDLLRHCLQATFDSLQGLASEVILVDNASADGSPQMVRHEFPEVHLIENTENVGFSRANNQAIQRSYGRFVLLLNSDAFPVGDAIPQMVKVMVTDPQIGIAGARLEYPDGRSQPSHYRLPTLRSELKSLIGFEIGLINQPEDFSHGCIETGSVLGACLMARREMLDQIGLLDESFYFFGEEVDLCTRAHAAGWQVVQVPAARVIHVGGGSTGRTGRRVLMLYREKLRYFGKYYGGRKQALLRAGMWLATLTKVGVYSVVRVLSAGRVRRDRLWLDVARGLPQIDAA